MAETNKPLKKLGFGVVVAGPPKPNEKGVHFNRVYITHVDRSTRPPRLTTFYGHRAGFKPGNDRNGVYRSGHSQVFLATCGHWPNAESHKTWFGWGVMQPNFTFFSCTLNTPDGWMTERAADRQHKKNLNDLVSPENFELLMRHLKEIKHLHYAIDECRQEYAALQSDRSSHHIVVKDAQKANINFRGNTTDAERIQLCEFFVAAINGDLATLESHRALINAQDDTGKTAVCHAATKGNAASVVKLLELGADWQIPDRWGSHALISAAEFGHTHVINELVKFGANVNEPNTKNFTTAITWAADKGYVAMIERLVELGAQVNSGDADEMTPVMWAARNGKTAAVEKLVELGADLNMKDEFYYKNALGIAEEAGKAETVRTLRLLMV